LKPDGKVAPLKIAPVQFVPEILTLVRFARERFARERFARERSAPVKFAAERFAPRRSASARIARLKSAPVKSRITRLARERSQATKFMIGNVVVVVLTTVVFVAVVDGLTTSWAGRVDGVFCTPSVVVGAIDFAGSGLAPPQVTLVTAPSAPRE
jgi:hypothetical protein